MTAKKNVSANISREVRVGKALSMCAQQILQGNDPLRDVPHAWATKSELSRLTGRATDWFERHASAGEIANRLEVTAERRARTLYRVADVRRLLDFRGRR